MNYINFLTKVIVRVTERGENWVSYIRLDNYKEFMKPVNVFDATHKQVKKNMNY